MGQETLTATFADGRSIRRNSRRDYKAAWCALVRRPDGTIWGNSGFARDATAADRAARSEANHVLRHYRGKAELISIEVVGVTRAGK